GESWLSRGARGKDALERQIAARRQVRANLNSKPRRHYALLLKLMTALMGLDLKLFGRLRAGPYFLLVEKV
ncbi:MAG TPA: methyltransferase type 11, partial [Anaerolineae bacterium]